MAKLKNEKEKSWGMFQKWCEDLFEQKLHNLDCWYPRYQI
jgi:hypothetical protein